MMMMLTAFLAVTMTVCPALMLIACLGLLPHKLITPMLTTCTVFPANLLALFAIPTNLTFPTNYSPCSTIEDARAVAGCAYLRDTARKAGVQGLECEYP